VAVWGRANVGLYVKGHAKKNLKAHCNAWWCEPLSVKLFLIFSSAILLASCVSASLEQTQRRVPVILSPQQTEVVKNGINDILSKRDLVFGPIVAGRNQNDDILVCGYVSTKNSGGGYSGQKIFNGVLSSNGKFVVGGVGENQSETLAVQTTCKLFGLII